MYTIHGIVARRRGIGTTRIAAAHALEELDGQKLDNCRVMQTLIGWDDKRGSVADARTAFILKNRHPVSRTNLLIHPVYLPLSGPGRRGPISTTPDLSASATMDTCGRGVASAVEPAEKLVMAFEAENARTVKREDTTK